MTAILNRVVDVGNTEEVVACVREVTLEELNRPQPGDRLKQLLTIVRHSCPIERIFEQPPRCADVGSQQIHLGQAPRREEDLPRIATVLGQFRGPHVGRLNLG